MKLPPFELERYFAEHEFTAPYLLCASDCESMPLKELLDLEPNARTELEKLWLGYSQSNGSADLRAIIAHQYETIQPHQVLVHTGAGEAIFNFMHSALDPGDHLIVQWPCYQSLSQVAESMGVRVTQWKGDPNQGWDLDIDFLKANLTPQTKAVVLNCPHNPTGYLMELGKLNEVLNCLDKHGVLLFMDEVYRGLEYEPAHALPPACDLYDKAISLGVLSKSFGLAGLRIGWVATRQDKVLESMARLKDYTTICNSAPSELLASVALRHAETLLDRSLKRVKGNLALLEAFFQRHPKEFEWHRPMAGCLAFPRLKQNRNADEYCATVLKNTGVLLAPGSKFRYEPAYFRIGFGRTNCAEALGRWEAFVGTK